MFILLCVLSMQQFCLDQHICGYMLYFVFGAILNLIFIHIYGWLINNNQKCISIFEWYKICYCVQCFKRSLLSANLQDCINLIKSWNVLVFIHTHRVRKKIWTPADFVRLPTDKEMISIYIFIFHAPTVILISFSIYLAFYYMGRGPCWFNWKLGDEKSDPC